VKRPSEAVARIVAYIVCRRDVDIAALKQRLKELLPDYMIPNSFERVDAIPLTSSGKADRKALLEQVIQLARS
jgi:acyl-CoA synthetase (AMP-forming)/AMP-acid ligase II